MPAAYLLVHLLLCAAVAWGVVRLPAGSHAKTAAGLAVVALAATGMVVERRPDWAWAAMWLGWPDLVFFTNLTLQGVTLLLVLVWRQARTPPVQRRAIMLTPLLVGASLWSYAWYFAPTPSGLHGRVDDAGYCAQTSDDSCSAAAAAMLLNAHGISTTEAEMAALCLTRAGHGTVPLGLYRGLWIKSSSGTGWRSPSVLTGFR